MSFFHFDSRFSSSNKLHYLSGRSGPIRFSWPIMVMAVTGGCPECIAFWGWSARAKMTDFEEPLSEEEKVNGFSLI